MKKIGMLLVSETQAHGHVRRQSGYAPIVKADNMLGEQPAPYGAQEDGNMLEWGF
jgi:putative transposase